MSIEVATLIVRGVQLYLALGAFFALVFSAFLVGRIDPAIRHSSWGFRIMLLPSSALLWPYLLFRVVRGTAPAIESNRHRACAQACPKRTGGAR